MRAMVASGFNMNLRAGGGRKLFVNFGAIVDCGGCKFDCVEDDSDPPFVVECPFPSGLRAKQDESQNGTPDEFVCSAFVKASLYELAAFDPLGEIPELRIQYMDARPRLCLLGDEEFCPPQCPGEDCVGPVLSLEGGGSISFRVPKPKGKQHTSWSIRFGDESGSCSMQSQPGFPDYLSIRALDTDSRGIGGFRADTWNIGTFETFGYNDPRLGCLTKLKGDEFIGFFEMSFMYTMEIKPVGLGE